MAMITAVTADVMNRLSPDAGVVLRNVDMSTIMDASGMATLIESARNDPEKWIGVTEGGIKITEGRTFWTANFDGKRMPFKGDKFLDTAEPKISFTLLEMTPENVKAASTAADVSGTGTKITVQPRASIATGDYMDNIVFATMIGYDGVYVCELKNALCVKGVDMSTADKEVGKLSVEFVGHQDDPTKIDTLPISYYFLSD